MSNKLSALYNWIETKHGDLPASKLNQQEKQEIADLLRPGPQEANDKLAKLLRESFAKYDPEWESSGRTRWFCQEIFDRLSTKPESQEAPQAEASKIARCCKTCAETETGFATDCKSDIAGKVDCIYPEFRCWTPKPAPVQSADQINDPGSNKDQIQSSEELESLLNEIDATFGGHAITLIESAFVAQRQAGREDGRREWFGEESKRNSDLIKSRDSVVQVANALKYATWNLQSLASAYGYESKECSEARVNCRITGDILDKSLSALDEMKGD